ncbi:MAG TPA: MBL fold metallo-hydrolase [Blastocatellia bacterium]|jgi:cAMP phosphodiesterase|nr:MBL fold metallo-hydrolase [Blastocatellia bacterium]
MKFRIVPSTTDGRVQLLTTYLINDTLAIDAGAIAIGLSREEQLRIRSIIITHTHLDHIFSLPLYLTDLFEEIREPVRLYATLSDFDALRQYVFNHRMWIPLELMRNAEADLISFHPIRSGESFFAEGLKVTPVEVTHTILTHGIVVEDDRSALLFTSDTGSTENIWRTPIGRDKLRAIFIDLSFPNRLTELARVSQHHSPATLLEEMSKMRPDTPIFAVHVKAAYRDQIVEEIESLNNPRIIVAEVGREYEF